jgi:hypothetical protein
VSSDNETGRTRGIQRRRIDWSLIRKVTLTLLAFLGIFIVFRQGLIPPRLSPLPAIVVERPFPLVVDWQLRELGADDALCRGLLSSKHVTGQKVSDRPLREGCGWTNAVRVSKIGDVRFPASRMNCGVAGAMAIWVENVVQPAARKYFEQDVVSMRQMGVYNCRNIIGSRFWGNRRSQHATANAVDVGAFRLRNGTVISVLDDWGKRNSPKGRFLREVHRGACSYFRVVLGPEFNRAHRDHFHFDRGNLWQCK